MNDRRITDIIIKGLRKVAGDDAAYGKDRLPKGINAHFMRRQLLQLPCNRLVDKTIFVFSPVKEWRLKWKLEVKIDDYEEDYEFPVAQNSDT